VLGNLKLSEGLLGVLPNAMPAGPMTQGTTKGVPLEVIVVEIVVVVVRVAYSERVVGTNLIHQH
jgi:hypothetical protein